MVNVLRCYVNDSVCVVADSAAMANLGLLYINVFGRDGGWN
jgi:hypothetical protein